MLHVVTPANRHLYRRQLQEMHRQRWELFVKSKGWDLKVRDGGEYDEGDDDRAVYLIAIDETGYCHSSIRVRPADDFSYLIDNMPEWLATPPEALRAEPGLWEMARWVSQGEDRSIGQELRIGLVEYLLTRGGAQCIACGDLDVTAYAIRTGWRLNFLGIPRRYPEGGIAVATSLPVTVAEVEHMRALYARQDPFLIEVPAEAPWARLTLPAIEAAYRACAARTGSNAALAEAADAMLALELSRHAA